MADDPFTLPDGHVQISFSGGRTSAYMLHQILAANGGLPERAKVVFANTGREMPETFDFVAEVGERWNVPIVWVEFRAEKPLFEVVSHNSASRDGEPFEALIRKRRMLPNQAMRFCTSELKVLAAKRYLVAQGWRRWTNAVGIRADEASRIRPAPDGERWTRWFPLADAGVTKATVMEFWRRQPFDLRVPQGLGNCDGCFLKSEATLAALARDHPDRHAWWERMEGVIPPTKGSACTFRKGVERRELRELVERQGDFLFSRPALLCQSTDGECVA